MLVTCHQPRRRGEIKEPPRKPPGLLCAPGPWGSGLEVLLRRGRPAFAPPGPRGPVRIRTLPLRWPDLLRLGSIEVRLRVLSNYSTDCGSLEGKRAATCELRASDSVHGTCMLLSSFAQKRKTGTKVLKSAAAEQGGHSHVRGGRTKVEPAGASFVRTYTSRPG